MKILRQIIALSLTLALSLLGIGFGLANNAEAQTRRRSTRRANDNQVEQIISSIERRSDAFRRSFDAALDRSRLDGTMTEDNVNDRVKAFEDATNDLRSRFNGRTAVAADVDNVLNRAALIDEFMRGHLRQLRVQDDWSLLKGDIERLANAYNVAFNLNGRILPPSVVATQRAYRVNDAQVQYLLNRIEAKSDTFHRTLDGALDRSRLNNTIREDNINEFVKDFENSTDTLRKKFDGRTSVDTDVSEVLVRAARIDDFMRRNQSRNNALQREWTSLRTDLNQLSDYYSLAFNLDNRRNMPPFPNAGALTNVDANFTGTYRLNTYHSGNVQKIADKATRDANTNNRDDIFRRLVSRLEAPEMLAIERQRTRVRLASSRSPQVSFNVDNRIHTETYPNGRVATVRASFSNNSLTIVSNGDRANDFTAIFTFLDNGRRMLVSRSVYAEQLSQPVEVKSYYDRMGETAQFNIFNGNSDAATGANVNNNFIVPNNTVISASLNNNISTKTATDNDRFTMTVNHPAQFSGATIEGYISNPERSGRVTGRSGLTLNYQTIRLPNNETYRFAGFTEMVTAANGSRVQIGSEGGVEADNSQTKTTLERTAIGAGIGAILGAIISGGKGAGVGAGTGAGSVYLQGRDDLELQSGSQVAIRASAPRNSNFVSVR